MVSQDLAQICWIIFISFMLQWHYDTWERKNLLLHLSLLQVSWEKLIFNSSFFRWKFLGEKLIKYYICHMQCEVYEPSSSSVANITTQLTNSGPITQFGCLFCGIGSCVLNISNKLVLYGLHLQRWLEILFILVN
jgi:hypothetical protein